MLQNNKTDINAIRVIGARNRSLGFEVKLAFGSGKGGGQMAYVQIRRFSRRGSYDWMQALRGFPGIAVEELVPIDASRRETTLTRTGYLHIYGLR